MEEGNLERAGQGPAAAPPPAPTEVSGVQPLRLHLLEFVVALARLQAEHDVDATRRKHDDH